MLKEYQALLEEYDEISNIKLIENSSIEFCIKIDSESHKIRFIFKKDQLDPIFIGYVDKPKDKVIPHLTEIGKSNIFYMCLSSSKEKFAFFKTPNEYLSFYIEKIKKLLRLNDDQIRKELRKEFNFFWNEFALETIMDKKIKLLLENYKKPVQLNVYNTKKKLVISSKELNDPNKLKQTCFKDALFIPLINTSKILPPLKNNKWDTEYIKKLIDYHISFDTISFLKKSIVKDSILIVISFNIPGILPVTKVLELQFNDNSKESIIKKINNKKLVEVKLFKSKRYDNKFLLERSGGDFNLYNKKVSLIGCGSLGSYIAAELPKLGISSLSLTDYDKLEPDNLYRHYLGEMYEGVNKSKGLEFYLSLHFPQLVISTRDKSIINPEDIDINGIDLLIIATGNTDLQLKFNKYFHENKIDIPVLFTWIETNGFGVHSLIVDYKKKGCFQCLYTDSKINKAHFYNGKSMKLLKTTGCGGIFNPYGNSILLKGSSLVLESIQKFYSKMNTSEENLLYSIKTNSGLEEHSDRYNYDIFTLENGTTEYVSKDCNTCG